jgi:hypothetical protein
MPTVTGRATDYITFSRASNATVTDSSGLIEWAGHNLLTNSESFYAAAWTKSSVTPTANSIAAPNGTTTADTLAASGANGTTLQTFTAEAISYTFGVWLKRKTGTGNIQIAADSGTYTTVTITSDWALYTVTQTPAAGSKSAGIRIVTSADEVYAWGAHLYRSDLGGMVLNPARGDAYYPTTPPNLLGYTEAFDNAAWTKTNILAFGSGSISNSIIAPNGLQTADTISENTANDVHALSQSITAVANTNFCASVYLKYIDCQYVTLALNKLATSTLWASAVFDLVNGTVSGTNASGGGTLVSSAISSVGNGWFRCNIIGNIGANTDLLLYVATANSATGASFRGAQVFTGTNRTFYAWGAQLSDSASLDTYSPVYGAAVTSAAYYAPRLDYDPSTLAAKGLLVEELRANLARWSNRLGVSHSLVVTGVTGTFQNGETVIATGGGSGIYVSALSSSSTFILTAGSGTFTGTLTGGTSAAIATISSATAIWTPSNVTTAATATGPDGTANSATTLTASAVNGTVLQAITSTSAARITSMYVKRRTGSGIIDMTQDNGTTWTTVTVTSSWTRVNIASTTAANPTVGIRIQTSGDAIDVFGMQHELGAFITSVIPTTTASATRSVDLASVSTQAFPYNATEGTLVVYYQPVYELSTYRTQINLTNDAGTNFARTRAFQTSTNIGANNQVQEGTLQVDYLSSGVASPYLIKTGIALKANDFANSTNGSAATPDTSGSMPTGITKLGFNGGAFDIGATYIRQITYLPRRLTNAELQARTT